MQRFYKEALLNYYINIYTITNPELDLTLRENL